MGWWVLFSGQQRSAANLKSPQTRFRNLNIVGTAFTFLPGPKTLHAEMKREDKANIVRQRARSKMNSEKNTVVCKWTATVSLFSLPFRRLGSLLSALWRVSCSLFCRTWRGLSFFPVKPKLRSMRGEPEVHKRDYLHLGVLDPSVPPDFTLDLGFIGSSHRDGKPRFRSSAPPPDWAERAGSRRRFSDGFKRTRLRATSRSLPAGEILLVPPLHGSTLRSV